MWDTFWGVRNRKMLFLLGQDRTTAFVDGYKFVRSRSSVLIIKYGGHAIVHLKSKFKMSLWSYISSGQNDHLVLLSKCQNDPLPSCVQVLIWALDFIGRFRPMIVNLKTMGQNDHLIFRTLSHIRSSGNFATWNQVSNLITWFLSLLTSVLLSADFCLSCSTSCGNSMRSNLFGYHRCGHKYLCTLHIPYSGELVRDSKDLFAYWLHLGGILHPPHLVAELLPLLIKHIHLRTNLERVLYEIILCIKYLPRNLACSEYIRARRTSSDGGIGFGILWNDLWYYAKEITVMEIERIKTSRLP